MTIRSTVAGARATPIPAGARSALVMRHGSMTLRHYKPEGRDLQTPHDQDEVYIVIAGTGRFTVDGETVDFGPGDALFAAAGADHRFVDFSNDFETWVIFYGPGGGEGGGEATG